MGKRAAQVISVLILWTAFASIFSVMLGYSRILFAAARDRNFFSIFAKLHATEAGSRVIDMAVQMHGGAGVTKGVKVEELYRDIRALRIYEGASEVQRQIIAKDMLRVARA